jgi:hypothetical protein
MDKTLADCWAYLQGTEPSSWYFCDALLELTDDPLPFGFESVLLPGGGLRIRMRADHLVALAALAPTTPNWPLIVGRTIKEPSVN